MSIESCLQEYSIHSADLRSAFEQSWDCYGKMTCLTVEQKQIVKSLYKNGRKIVHLECHIKFLEKCLEIEFIPKSFQIKNSL